MLQVEIVAHTISSMMHCAHCQVFLDEAGVGTQVHRENLQAYPPEWQKEWERLSELVEHPAQRFAGRIVIPLTDAQSLRGLWWAICGVRRYPTFIVGGEERLSTWDEERITQCIQRWLEKTDPVR